MGFSAVAYLLYLKALEMVGICQCFYYYLLIYLFLNLWFRISSVTSRYAPCFWGEALIKKTYGAPKILYINVTEEEEKSFQLYIDDPLKTMETIDYDIVPDCFLPLLHVQFEREFVLEGGTYVGQYTKKEYLANLVQKIEDKYFAPDASNPESQEYYEETKNVNK